MMNVHIIYDFYWVQVDLTISSLGEDQIENWMGLLMLEHLELCYLVGNRALQGKQLYKGILLFAKKHYIWQ